MAKPTAPAVADASPLLAEATTYAAPAVVVSPSPMAIIAEAVKAGRSPEELRALFDLQERWERNRAAEAYANAITEFQRRCPVLRKSRTAEITSQRTGSKWSYKFAPYEDLMKEIGPLLAELRIAMTFAIKATGPGMIECVCRLRVGIHFEDHPVPLAIPAQMLVNDAQKYGAAHSFAKRYSAKAALNLVEEGEDTDGGGLNDTITPEQAEEIATLVRDSKSQMARFLDWVTKTAGFKVGKIADMPPSIYANAIDTLKRKRDSLKGGSR